MTARVLLLVFVSSTTAQAVEVRGTLNTIMAGREDPRNGEGVLVIPVYELISMEVAQLTLPGTDSARVVLNGWGRLQLGDDEALEGHDADLALLFLDSRMGPVRFTLGRQHIVSGVGRMTLIDGANTRIDFDAGISAQGFFGWTVHPQLRHRTDNSQGGGRVAFNFQQLGQKGEVGIAYLLRTQTGDIRRHEIGADAFTVLGPTNWVAAAVVSPGHEEINLVEARLAGTWNANKQLALTVDVERVTTEMFLPMNSIFTVFANSAHDAFGLDVRWEPSPYWSVDASGHGLRLDGETLGYRTTLRTVTYREPAHRSMIGAEIRRLDELENGYVRGRLFAALQILESMRLSADVFAYHFDEEVNAIPYSILGQLSVIYDIFDSLRVAATVAGGSTPWAEAQLEGMLRIAYGWNVDLASEVGP